MCVFLLFSVFAGSIAWFNVTQAATNNANEMGIGTINGCLSSITFHNFLSKTRDSTSGDPTSFTFDSTASGTITYDWSAKDATFTATSEGDTSIALNTYEPLDKEQPLLLIFHLDQAYEAGNGTISISATAEGDGFIGEKNADATPKYDLDSSDVIYKTVSDVNYYWLSSVVQFYNISFEDDSLSYTYALTSDYATSASLPLLESSESKFTTADNENDTCSFSNTASLYSSTSGDTVKNIGVVIDYYPDAIEYIYSTYLGNSVLETTYDGYMNFWCDWSTEVI
ncbi:MAG: hypothetical protein K6F32_07635 [Bacilli bacterium]|nr:hypothetical protein [Bacilli bacterium]